MKQTEALAILKTGLNVFLTGEPGSGKTHTINRYIDWLNKRGVDVAVTASTGIAATHVGGMTIHSWSGIGIKKNVSEWDIDAIMSKEKTAHRILDAKVLVIDEISMLDAETLESVDRVLRNVRRGVLQEPKPFGGLQIIFVGDFFQLPPVTRGKEETRFAFESKSWKEANPIICYLSEQHRQEDGDFLNMLGALRRSSFSENNKTQLKKRMHITPEKNVATRLYTHNADVDRMNDDALAKIEGKSHVFHMTSRGARSLVESLKNNCLSPESLTLKEGAAVMFTRNNPDVGYVNGTLGTVIGFSPLGTPIVKTRTGKTISVEPIDWAIQDGNKILAKITQVPLRLAWAITVHKSQGMSLDAAVIDLSQAFEFGQGYVALSRVRTLQGLFLEGFNDRALMLHPKVADADRYFRAYSEAAQKKFASLPQSEKDTLEQNFLRAVGAHEEREVETVQPVKNKLEILREKFPNAGRSWSTEDDAILTDMFKAKKKYAEIGKHFGRKPSAIEARLGHLGLIEKTWFQRRGQKKKQPS